MQLPETQVAAAVEKFNACDPAAAISVLRDWPVPEPSDGEVLVHVKLRPVNPSDIFTLKGIYGGFNPKCFPAVPGLEGKDICARIELVVLFYSSST